MRVSRIRKVRERLARWQRGNVLIAFALSTAILVAAAGLGTEVAAWYSQKRDMQNAADLAADSAIVSLARNFEFIDSSTANTIRGYARNDARATAASHGYSDADPDTSISVAIKPADTPVISSSAWNTAPDNGAVEVVITKPGPLLFSHLFLTAAPSIVVRAVAAMDYSHSICMLSLSPSQDMAVEIIGSANLTLDCSVAVNSNNSGTNGTGQRNVALYLQGGAGSVLHAYDVTVVGDWGGPGNATIQVEDQLTSPGSVTTDPYGPQGERPLTIPTDCGCGNTMTADQALAQGALFGGANINGDLNIGATLSLNPGIYVVNGNINISSGGNLVSNGATIILNSTAENNYTFNMQSTQANIRLVAPNWSSNLATAGFALIQSRGAPTDVILQNGDCTVNCSVIQGGPTMSITGVVYFPNGNLRYQGSASSPTGCTQIIADSLRYQGGPLFVNACAGTGVLLFGSPHAFLAE